MFWIGAVVLHLMEFICVREPLHPNKNEEKENGEGKRRAASEEWGGIGKIQGEDDRTRERGHGHKAYDSD